MRAYHDWRGDRKRDKVIVPDSAHGTNPASAAVAGLKVVEVKSLPDGTVDVDALRPLLDDTVAGMMMTNPNTLGIFERRIPEIAAMVHEAGGLMYYDGANLNPLLGMSPSRRYGIRHNAHQPPQDILHASWRRRPRIGACGCACRTGASVADA